MSSPTSEQFRRPFTLAGAITAWNVVTRELTILGYTLRLAPLGRRPDICRKEKWRIFSVGLEPTAVTPLAGRTERRYADADVATEDGRGQAGRH